MLMKAIDSMSSSMKIINSTSSSGNTHNSNNINDYNNHGNRAVGRGSRGRGRKRNNTSYWNYNIIIIHSILLLNWSQTCQSRLFPVHVNVHLPLSKPSIPSLRNKFKLPTSLTTFKKDIATIVQLRGGGEGGNGGKSKKVSKYHGQYKRKKRKRSSSSNLARENTMEDKIPSKNEKDTTGSNTSTSSPCSTNDRNKSDEYENDNNSNYSHSDLPIIEAILIPKQVSLPRMIRLISAMLFTSSLLECLRTSGAPFTNAVIDTLLSHGIKPQYYKDGDSGSGSSSITMSTNSKQGSSGSGSVSSISSFDIYMARKIASASLSDSDNTNPIITLPPSFLPKPIPFIGLLLSLVLYFGISLLFPYWFVQFETWLNYDKVKIIHDIKNLNHGTEEKRCWISNEKMKEIQYILQKNIECNNKDTRGDHDDDKEGQDPYYYQSQLMNRPNIADKTLTGLAVLVHLSKYDQEMGEVGGKSHVIRWLHYEESDDTNDINGSTNYDGVKYYIELNQRRIYINMDIEKVAVQHTKQQASCYTITTKCRDGSPTFYKTESIQQLHSRLYNGIMHSHGENSATATARATRSITKSIQKLQRYQNQYEKHNKLDLPIPTIEKAFLSRISTPLSIMQFVGKLLSVFEDDSLTPSMINIMSTLGRHYWNARNSIVSAKELAMEITGNVQGGVEEQMYWTLRPQLITRKKKRKKQKQSHSSSSIGVGFQDNEMEQVIQNRWELIPSSQILPEDIFCFPPNGLGGANKERKNSKNQSNDGTIMPVDSLLLEGRCVALEAVITGESVPQAKIAMDIDEPQKKLCLETTHRSSALFAGTNVMQCINESYFSANRGVNSAPKLPKKYLKSLSLLAVQPVKCLALRTGSYSSKGEIVRALSKSKRHTGSITTPESERDSIKLISVLTTFACVACASLFIPSLQIQGGNERGVSTFRRVIQCTRIAVASIPSDLPLALSHVAQSCATKLQNDADVVCAEPGSLLTAAKIDMVVFDKTGTLTSDTQALKMVIPNPSKVINDNKHSYMIDVVLAGCHSLVSINQSKKGKNKFVGDPLDIASLEYSKWTFDSSEKSASARAKKSVSDPWSTKKLWQIKTFPFDATRRRSSALVLVLHEDKFRLWKVLKGSPDGMTSFLCFKNETNEELSNEAYIDEVEDLGSQGFRVITMAAKDVSNDDTLVRKLFPDGLPTRNSFKNGLVIEIVSRARKVAQDIISVNDIETTSSGCFDLIGLSCFDTEIRPSTTRVVRDLRASGINVCMLTGDAPEAALAVARNAGFYNKKSTKRNFLLDLNGDNNLSWTLTKEGHMSRKKNINFCFRSAENILIDSKLKKCTIVITGRAFDHILQSMSNAITDDKHIACLYLMKNLKQIPVISRSSPNTKQKVVSSLKTYCNVNVMMCGDGVNDIAAMKTADVSAALLTGYGKETIGDDSIDTENERRKSKLNQRQSGVMAKPQKRLLTREQKMVLKKGGAAAARILAEDDMLRNSLRLKSEAKYDGSKDKEKIDDIEIKPGEASLAAPFTFLRPCVDGTESILRSGIAAVAFSLSCHRSIALNSLMSCFNLATLYQNGFHYGKYLWNVELSLIMALDQGQHEISSMPRPRVSQIRPHQSIFHPSSALSILLQSLCHLYILTYGHHAATIIEKKYGKSFKKGISVRLINPKLFGPLGELFKSSSVSQDGKTNIFGKKVFEPNHITNAVFIISCFQNTMIGLINHIGAPFNGSILESRSFCFWIGTSILFCIITATETYKPLNTILELAPIPSKCAKLLLLVLMAFDGVTCFVIDRLCIYLLDRGRWNAAKKRVKIQKGMDHAADFEENMLQEERKINQTLIIGFSLIGIMLIIQYAIL